MTSEIHLDDILRISWKSSGNLFWATSGDHVADIIHPFSYILFSSPPHLLFFISCRMKKRRVTVLPAVTAPHAYTLWAVTAFKINPHLNVTQLFQPVFP